MPTETVNDGEELQATNCSLDTLSKKWQRGYRSAVVHLRSKHAVFSVLCMRFVVLQYRSRWRAWIQVLEHAQS